MGKRDDWCSSKGLNNRKKGMYKMETKGRKFCILALFIISAITYIVIGSLHASRSANANKINEDFEDDQIAYLKGKLLRRLESEPEENILVAVYDYAYDGCFIPSYEPDPSLNVFDAQQLQKDLFDVCGYDLACYRQGTLWSFIWTYNAIWILIMGVNFIFLSMGAFWFWPRLIGTWLNCCFGCCHCSAISYLVVGVMGPYGRICSYNVSTSTYLGDIQQWDEDGMTYQNDHGLMLTLAMLQTILITAQCCCCWVPLCGTPVLDEEHAQRKAEKEQARQAQSDMAHMNMMMAQGAQPIQVGLPVQGQPQAAITPYQEQMQYQQQVMQQQQMIYANIQQQN